ncbi:hypothetical protein A33Q_0171 [Indibacter alkaliphilus LW1]|uniref:Uncharacterized protein n=1 Tax=Indibacter alkaliphilus (strain CCUG 57479 / KCTC 22604 / LW1) TaxID=1189612 RepID=S2DM12_INDAL|nr:hypothetical protein A33Q_0171 [Indibacter alkaliphilus LW1]
MKISLYLTLQEIKPGLSQTLSLSGLDKTFNTNWVVWDQQIAVISFL